LRGEKPDKPEQGYTWEDLVTLNEKTFLENRGRTLNDVQADSRLAYQQLLEQVQALSEDDITNPHRFPWTGGHELVPFIAANSYEHYQEHFAQIHKWLADEPLQSRAKTWFPNKLLVYWVGKVYFKQVVARFPPITVSNTLQPLVLRPPSRPGATSPGT